jgi:hypothetical protein
MEQLLLKTRGIVSKNKKQKHLAFYFVVQDNTTDT